MSSSSSSSSSTPPSREVFLLAKELRAVSQAAAQALADGEDLALFRELYSKCRQTAARGGASYSSRGVLAERLRNQPRVVTKLEELGYAVEVGDVSVQDADVPCYKLTIMW